MLLRTIVALALLCTVPGTALGQGIVGGRVREIASKRPVGCLSVALLDSSAHAVARTQTREDGTFELAAPTRGMYRWEFSAFGLRPVATPPVAFDESSDSELAYDIELMPHDSLLTLWREAKGDSVPLPDRRSRPAVPGFPQALLDRGVTRADALVAHVVDARGRSDSATAFRLYASAPEIYPNVLSIVHTSRSVPARANGVAVCRLIVSPFTIERQSMSVPR